MALISRPGFVVLALITGTIASTIGGTTAASADSLSQLSLADSVSAAQQHQAGNSPSLADTPYQSSTWLAALPSIGLSYLGSDENQGTDETELSLNLPIKSAAARKYDSDLQDLAELIVNAESQRRRLYLSGLVREALWSQRIAKIRGQYSEKKIALLEELLERQQTLFEARSASRYSLLLIRQELVDARIRQREFRWEVDNWQRRFQMVTGIGTLPDDITEPVLVGTPDYSQHPQLRLLDLNWQRQQSVIAAGSGNSTPWTVALTAKQLDNPQLDENQYGVALDIPLTVFDLSSESTRADWQAASRGYWQSRDELQLSLKQRWEALAGEATYLLTQQTLLDESSTISQQLIGETRALMGQNELGREIWVRRILRDIDKQAESAINKLRTGQNLAMKRQAAGIPL